MFENDNIEITEIIPIRTNPDKSEIIEILKTIEENNNSSCLSPIYTFNEKFVLKNVFQHFEAEVENLKSLYEAEKSGLNLGNSQKGLYAFKTNNEFIEGYIVSTKVEGCSAYDLPDSNITENHFRSLLDIIYNLDITPLEKSDEKESNIFLVLDYNTNNIHFSDTSAGLLDFEYIKKENINNYLNTVSKNIYHSNAFDDTGSLPCNLRLFEIGFFWKFFLSFPTKVMPKKDKRKIFNNYLKVKSDHLQRLSKTHKKLSSKKNQWSKILAKMSKDELVHSKLLSNLSEDIVLAEIYKIQLANLYFQIFELSWLNIPVSIDFIKAYKRNTEQYLKGSLKKAKEEKDSERILYFNNCINFYNQFIDIEKINYNSKYRKTHKSIALLNDMLL